MSPQSLMLCWQCVILGLTHGTVLQSRALGVRVWVLLPVSGLDKIQGIEGAVVISCCFGLFCLPWTVFPLWCPSAKPPHLGASQWCTETSIHCEANKPFLNSGWAILSFGNQKMNTTEMVNKVCNGQRNNLYPDGAPGKCELCYLEREQFKTEQLLVSEFFI